MTSQTALLMATDVWSGSNPNQQTSTVQTPESSGKTRDLLIAIPIELHTKVKIYAARQGIPMVAMIRQLLEKHCS